MWGKVVADKEREQGGRDELHGAFPLAEKPAHPTRSGPSAGLLAPSQCKHFSEDGVSRAFGLWQGLDAHRPRPSRKDQAFPSEGSLALWNLTDLIQILTPPPRGCVAVGASLALSALCCSSLKEGAGTLCLWVCGEPRGAWMWCAWHMAAVCIWLLFLCQCLTDRMEGVGGSSALKG